MTLNRDAVAALALLAAFLGFGYEATLVELFPGQETEVFSPRTMPLALAVGGTLLCFARLVQSLRHPEPGQVALGGFDWRRAGLLCVTMIGYGLLFEPLGFLLATAVFLSAGFLVLGERRVLMLTVLPLVFAALFWLLMTKVLGLYLAPGLLGS